MIKLPKPDIKIEDILNACISNMHKHSILLHIKQSSTAIIANSVAYDDLGEKGILDKVPMQNSMQLTVTKEDMIWLYDNKFVAGGGKKYYDRLKSIPKYGKCPFCGVGIVSTLDHYLPKTEYPIYAVTPFNLVASCFDCNKKKANAIIASASKKFIHPYYEDFDDEIWLKVRVIYEYEITFQFYVEKPENWNKEKYERAKNHFEKLDLNSLYVSHCGEEFVEYEYTARRLYKTGKIELVIDDLKDRILERRRLMKNNWRAALYEGLLENIDVLDKYLKFEMVSESKDNT